MTRLGSTPEVRARKRAEDFTALVWHALAFVVVNVFMWVMDIVQGGGIEYAFWTTIPWGFGLAFHAAVYRFGNGDVEERRYQRFLDEELRRHSELP